MEELIYLCVRIACIGYLLYRVYGWKNVSEPSVPCFMPDLA